MSPKFEKLYQDLCDLIKALSPPPPPPGSRLVTGAELDAVMESVTFNEDAIRRCSPLRITVFNFDFGDGFTYIFDLEARTFTGWLSPPVAYADTGIRFSK